MQYSYIKASTCSIVIHHFSYNVLLRAVEGNITKIHLSKDKLTKKLPCPDKNILVRQLSIYHNNQTFDVSLGEEEKFRNIVEKNEIFNICKISFNKRYLLHTYILLCTIATFQKAGTCLEAQQSMAKQPIKGCVNNHSRTCGESVSEKSE